MGKAVEKRSAGHSVFAAPFARRHRRARGITIVPLEIIWVDARAKLVIGLGTGKKKHDKRESMKKKAHQRDIERER